MQRILRYLPIWLALVLIPLVSQGKGVTTTAATPSIAGQTVTAPVGTIAYTSVRGGVPNIFVVHTDGTAPHLLIPNAAMPALSPNGSKLAFARGKDIYVANIDGSGIRPVTDNAGVMLAIHPAFNAAGNGLVYALGPEATGGPFAIEMVNLDGSGQKVVATNGLDPIYTPDGIDIVFAREGTIQMMAIPHMGQPGFQPSALIAPGLAAHLRSPAISPNAAYFAYTILPAQGPQIPGIRLVTNTGQRTDTGWETGAAQPAFSPDGTRIAFTRLGDIFVKPILDGTQLRLTSGGVNGDPVWLK